MWAYRPKARAIIGWSVVLAAAGFVAAFAAALTAAPAADDLPARASQFAKLHGVHRVSLDAVSPLLRSAVVATEDERFYHHGGVDLIGILRAIPYDLSHFSLAEGASTIPEQLAKILYLGGSDRSPWRKAENVAVALRLGQRYSHEQVLDAYLNVAYFGEGAWGVEAASGRFFARSASRLTLAQATLLAGLVQAPSSYDPAQSPRAARARQAEVLRSMVRNGFITGAEGSAALAEPLRLADGKALAGLRGVDLEPGAPFDWAELAAAALLLTSSLAAFSLARRSAVGPFGRRLALQSLSFLLLLASAFAAAHSVQSI